MPQMSAWFFEAPNDKPSPFFLPSNIVQATSYLSNQALLPSARIPPANLVTTPKPIVINPIQPYHES